MRGVYSIPAVIEVCAMKRAYVCTEYGDQVPYGHPLFFPEVLRTS